MGVLADGWQAASLDQLLGHGPDGHEEVELIRSSGSGWIFGCRHMPAAGGAVSGVVVCPPTLTDTAINYHREARVGRRLARAGVATQRFQYRGTGESDEVPGGISFASLLEDTHRALDVLRERCGVERVGFLGTRVGALVAAKIAADFPGAPLALWQPVIDPRRYLYDSVAVDSGRWSGTVSVPPPVPGLPGPMDPGGPAGPGAPGGPGGSGGAHGPSDGPEGDGGPGRSNPASSLLELPLGRDLFDPSVIDNLVDAAGRRPRPILLVQLHRRVGLAPDYRAAIGRWQALGFPVDVAYDPTEDDWWQVHPGWEPSDEVLTVTSTWLSTRLAPSPGSWADDV